MLKGSVLGPVLLNLNVCDVMEDTISTTTRQTQYGDDPMFYDYGKVNRYNFKNSE